MHISRLFCSLLLSAACLVPAQAQLFTSSDSKRTAPGQNRTLRYQPDGEDFVIVNGNRKFTRALYGSNTGFRLETSDVPEFALYMPRMGGNLSLGVIVGGKSLWLNDARHIESRYSAGSRIYTITDSLLGKGSIVVTALAMYEADGMILKIEGNKLPSDTRLVWLYGGPTNKRFSREGDMGVDAPDCFDLKPDYCVDNIYRLDDDGFDVWYGTSREKIQRYLAGKNPETGKNPVCQLTAVVPDASSLLLGDAMARTTPISLRETAPSDKYPVVSGTVSLRKKPSYIAIYNPKTAPAAWRYDDLAACFDRADKSRAEVASTVKLVTPDPYFNTLGPALSMAADGIWDSSAKVWMHGAIGWRMPLNGWRAAYTGDAIGRHDRAREHFDGYAASQITEIEPVIPHPAQDSSLNLARALKKWGTQMYSNGYITRNPNQKKLMHHYDMNLCYIDELLWHFNWTGDMDYVRRMWPVLKSHLAWEKRNFDPDDDGLYDAYCCIWASDALQYNSGGVTHSSAYNYRANKMAAEIAEKIGEDPEPYRLEAEKIGKAINDNLWLSDKGHWAEYKDFMGLKRVHPDAALWTVYHAIDSEIHDDFQSWQATRYVDTEIPHIPVKADGLDREDYATIATTTWLPYAWSINNVAFAEVMHTALAYWQSGRSNEAYKLFKSSILDGMYLGGSPGNFGQVSTYDAARGECYRDFGDPVGVASRVIVQGLFGILPDMMNDRVVLRPGFPSDWEYASFETSDIAYDFKRKGNKDVYEVQLHFERPATLALQLKARRDKIASVKVNGKKTTWTLKENSVGEPQIEILAQPVPSCKIEVAWEGKPLSMPEYDTLAIVGSSWKLSLPLSVQLMAVRDEQNLLSQTRWDAHSVSAVVRDNVGERTLFVQLSQGDMTWWQPIPLTVMQPVTLASSATEGYALSFALANHTAKPLSLKCVVNPGRYEYVVSTEIPANGISPDIFVPASCAEPGTNRVVVYDKEKEVARFDCINWEVKNSNALHYESVDLDTCMNARVTDIFENRYLSPRSPYTTLQVPVQGIGEWCHPKATAEIDDSGLRRAASGDVLDTPIGVPFRIRQDTTVNNVLFTTRWDNYPDSVTVPLSGRASRVYLLMAGSTNHMQCHMVNGLVTVTYTDGTTSTLPLVNPETWCPIDQDFYVDGYAFSLKAPRPYRVLLKSGVITRDVESYLKLRGADNRNIPGGAGVILDLPLDGTRTLQSITVSAVSTEVVIGLMAVTLER